MPQWPPPTLNEEQFQTDGPGYGPIRPEAQQPPPLPDMSVLEEQAPSLGVYPMPPPPTGLPPLPGIPGQAIDIKQEAPAARPPPRDLRDPAFVGFLADRAAQRADLAKAQGQADESRRYANMSNSFAKMRDIILQRPFDQEGMAANLAQANQPVTNVLQQQKSSADATKAFSEEQTANSALMGERRKLDAQDPESDLSHRAQQLLQFSGLAPAGKDVSFLSADEANHFLEAAKVQGGLEHARAQLAAAVAQHEESARHNRAGEAQAGATLTEHTRHNKAGELMAKTKFERLPEHTGKQLGAAIDALETIGSAKNSRSAFSPFEYGRMADAVASSVAAADSPSGSASSGLIKRERDLMPSAFGMSGDTYFDQKHKQLLSKVQGEIAAAKAKGFDVTEYEARLARGAHGVAGGKAAGPVKVGSDADYNALPSGTEFVGPDGQHRRKP